MRKSPEEASEIIKSKYEMRCPVSSVEGEGIELGGSSLSFPRPYTQNVSHCPTPASGPIKGRLVRRPRDSNEVYHANPIEKAIDAKQTEHLEIQNNVRVSFGSLGEEEQS